MVYQSPYSGAQVDQSVANGLAIGQITGIIKSDGANVFSAGQVNLATEATGVLPIANGGTGNNTGFVRAGLRANTTAGSNATAEGYNSRPTGNYSHAEGQQTTASGVASHSENYNTTASGHSSHAEGQNTNAGGIASHAEGLNTYASSDYQHVSGKFNVDDASNTYVFIVGNGTSTVSRSNALTLDWSGNLVISGHYTDGDGTLLALASDADVQDIIDNYQGA